MDNDEALLIVTWLTNPLSLVLVSSAPLGPARSTSFSTRRRSRTRLTSSLGRPMKQARATTLTASSPRPAGAQGQCHPGRCSRRSTRPTSMGSSRPSKACFHLEGAQGGAHQGGLATRPPRRGIPQRLLPTLPLLRPIPPHHRPILLPLRPTLPLLLLTLPPPQPTLLLLRPTLPQAPTTLPPPLLTLLPLQPTPPLPLPTAPKELPTWIRVVVTPHSSVWSIPHLRSPPTSRLLPTYRLLIMSPRLTTRPRCPPQMQ